MQYILTTASLSPILPGNPLYIPSPPDPLLLYFPSEKSRAPRDINWTQYNEVQ